MSTSVERSKVYAEIERIPEDKLPEIYELLRSFRADQGGAQEGETSVMRFAGAWQDMPDATFAAFVQEIVQRRQRAFSRRRARETGTD